MSSDRKSVIIVGAGIVGLTSAWQLTRSNYDVTVFDPSPGRGATWAAAGMIAPHAEVAPGELANFQLQRGALAAWQKLAAELADEVGRQIRIEITGSMMTGWDASDRRQVEQFLQVARTFGVESTLVSRDSHPEMFLGLSQRISRGALLGRDAWINPDEAVSVLLEALAAHDVHVIEHRVDAIDGDERGVRVHYAHGSLAADTGLLATGAFGLPEGSTPSGTHAVRPVRGMTVRVQGLDRSQAPTLRCIVRGRPFYMVSRPGGYGVIGASSEEHAGPLIEVAEMQRLLRDALDVVPELETASLLETRVGLRPASTDLEPFFEQWRDRRWAWSSGHFRHGVTVAPLTAHAAVDFANMVTA